jgi:glycosyltransferase involved in cell wall biosynthesis
MVHSSINVLHVTSNLAGGGVQYQLVKSLGVLDRVNFSHQVCCVSGGGIYERELEALGVPYQIMNRRARFDPAVLFHMAALMKRGRIDVVHTLNFTANAWGRVAAQLAGVPGIIAHEHGTAWTENAAMRFTDRALSRITDVWLTNSEASRTMLTRHVGIPKARTRVIYNGMPSVGGVRRHGPLLRETLGLKPDVPIVGAVGRLDTPKGHSYLLRSVPHVLKAFPAAHFVIVGDGPLRASLEDKAARLGRHLQGHIHFAGFLNNASGLMPEMAVLVQPSIRESLGNTLIEAALAGLPVVATNVDGIPEVVVQGETGFLVDCSESVEYVAARGTSPLPKVVVDGSTGKLRRPLGPDPVALAGAIIDLLSDSRLRSHMGEQARERARRYFDLDRYARDLEAVYSADL